jgi:hypothetical protein
MLRYPDIFDGGEWGRKDVHVVGRCSYPRPFPFRYVPECVCSSSLMSEVDVVDPCCLRQFMDGLMIGMDDTSALTNVAFLGARPLAT